MVTQHVARPGSVRLLLGISMTVIACLVLTASAEDPVQPLLPPPPSALPTPPPPPPPVPAVVGTPPGKVDPGMPVFVDMSVRSSNGAPTVAKWQYIRGAEAFNARLDTRLLGILDAQAGGRHEPSALDTAAAPAADGLSVDHEVVVAAGNIVGTRFVQAAWNQGVRTGYAEEITYEDLSTGVVFGSAALINPDRIGVLRKMLREVPLNPSLARDQNTKPATATDQASAPSTQPAAETGPIADGDLLSAVAFTQTGQVSVTLSKHLDTGAALAAPTTVILNSDFTRKILSPTGRALHRDVIAGTPFIAPAPAPGSAEHINCDIVACAALTYDDGPNPQTARLLEILENHQVKATFFLQGQYVHSYPQVARSAAAAGHTLANHTMNHPYLTRIPGPAVADEVRRAQVTIENATGAVPVYLRPPYGATNPSVSASAGLPQILWDVDSLDWQSRDKAAFIPRIMNLVKPGSIILQHDIHAATVDGQDELIAALKGKGFHLVTLPQLFAGIELNPYGTYKCRGTSPGCVPGR